ncbi:MAG: iron chaperone [Chloroflexota bacterium]
MNPTKDTKKPAKSKANQGLSKEEIAAMKETIKERKMAANKEEMEKAALEAIAKMKEPDRSLAKRIHEIVKASAPGLTPKTWYGMPAYANADGKVICFFQAASKFGVRYATFGFQPDAKLDEGNMWAASFALIKLTPAEEAKITALVKKAVS